jgi:hypothetical protein
MKADVRKQSQLQGMWISVFCMMWACLNNGYLGGYSGSSHRTWFTMTAHAAHAGYELM